MRTRCHAGLVTVLVSRSIVQEAQLLAAVQVIVAVRSSCCSCS
jgi:hypothetical protein